MSTLTPTLLLILDGWGMAPQGEGNAVSLARTPVLDSLPLRFAHARLTCSGRAVGLPEGFMGNSEVGHMNIGAGRVIYQDMTRIDVAIEDGSFRANPVLGKLLADIKASGGRLHLMGLVSDGGVHSHIRHIVALLELARDAGVEVLVHAFMDGRDTGPTSGKGYLEALQGAMDNLKSGRIATICGRYYAMDRDKRWDRVQVAWDCLVHGRGDSVPEAVAAVQAAYDAGVTDEFIRPSVIVENRDGTELQPVAPVQDNDGMFFFNFRADRARELTRAFIDDAFEEFPRGRRPKLAGFATMTAYDAMFPLPVAFTKEAGTDTLGETVAHAGLRQLRIAETEKYAHVTYFFNCGREEPFPGEDRILVNSPRDVATYDLKPEMSVPEVTERLLEAWKSGAYDLVVCNLANLDMVGHTGSIPAAVAACEAVDGCVGRILQAVLDSGGRALVTADHGNAEEMLDAKGLPQTAHSMNPVPLVLVENNSQVTLQREGILGDIAPTILDLWGTKQPDAMTGSSLVVKA
ncbi:2,3-bisphosphoglycerate-independent phosphoglycerate mutase [Desulfovibrio psychrotolerans]|uniref:2,3-bisphosphoglycerate-independent phosphoglycerate mutase n=1 Tax=Desulfovibrio psychrotolerans TaxID=415242 RepID=A0A7J0BP44_9BACT|nr:2,3-bisphosphoglycerate-independent phosphoglycerate mutase [Desulfovibrio psychrotolerans]GFM35430.1 2,3-bisphosphoglycerate-independent phosphoglycerate mutase [Desulfovibrio psychrotolerans]